MAKDIDSRWQTLLALLAELTGKHKITTEAILLLIGIQETGQLHTPLGKEEKYNLIHVGMCTILLAPGYYSKTHIDAEGWPHFALAQPLPAMDVFEQAAFMREHILAYFASTWPQLAAD